MLNKIYRNDVSRRLDHRAIISLALTLSSELPVVLSSPDWCCCESTRSSLLSAECRGTTYEESDTKSPYSLPTPAKRVVQVVIAALSLTDVMVLVQLIGNCEKSSLPCSLCHACSRPTSHDRQQKVFSCERHSMVLYPGGEPLSAKFDWSL